MKKVKPILRRLLMLAPLLSLFAGMSSPSDPEGTVHVSTLKSMKLELAECAKVEDPQNKKFCEKLRKAAEAELETDECLADECVIYMETSGMPAPTPCPTSQCLPFWEIPRMSYYTEKDIRRIDVLVNGQRVGTAKHVSYDAKTKRRTVVFDLRNSFTNSKGEKQNLMMVRVPVTYLESGRKVKGTIVIKGRF